MRWAGLAEVILNYSNYILPQVDGACQVGPAAVSLAAQAAGQGPLTYSRDSRGVNEGWHLTEDQKQQARALFLTGASVGAVARHTGMALSSAQRVLKTEVTASGRGGVTWRVMTLAEVEEARQLRTEGWTYEALGKRYGVSRTAVAKRLRT